MTCGLMLLFALYFLCMGSHSNLFYVHGSSSLQSIRSLQSSYSCPFYFENLAMAFVWPHKFMDLAKTLTDIHKLSSGAVHKLRRVVFPRFRATRVAHRCHSQLSVVRNVEEACHAVSVGALPLIRTEDRRGGQQAHHVSALQLLCLLRSH
jgi:hypothetical protein